MGVVGTRKIFWWVLKGETMEIKQSGSGFFIESENKMVAQLVYTMLPNNVLAINSVVVNPEFRGQGIATKIVNHCVEYAREHKLVIKPICSFAVAEFARRKDYADVLSN